LLATLGGCGGPLDRADGAVVLVLRGAPEATREVEVQARAGARAFHLRRPRPADDRIADLSAVPAGPMVFDVRALGPDGVLAERAGIQVEVPLDATVTTTVTLGGAPEVELERPREGAAHRVDRGPIVVSLRAADPSRRLEVGLTANGRPVPIVDAGVAWVAHVEPTLAGRELPATLELVLTACADGACVRLERQVLVHRRLGAAQMGRANLHAPWLEGDEAWLGDADGRVWRWNLGAPETPAVGMAELRPPLGPIVVEADRAWVVDGDGALVGLPLAGGPPTRLALPPGPHAGPSRRRDPGRPGLVLSAGRRLLAVDAEGRRVEPLAELGAEAAAAPLADAEGVVALDQGGGLVFVEGAAVARRLELGFAALAPPARIDGRLWVASLDGAVWRIEPDADPEGPFDALEAPVVFAPAATPIGPVFAAGDRVIWVGRARVEVALGVAITAPPVPYPGAGDASVLVGRRDGRLERVAPDAGRRPVQALPAAIVALVPLDAPPRVLAISADGRLELLRLEDP
jgi:hypothetical protein